jgi:hypothetical protein
MNDGEQRIGVERDVGRVDCGEEAARPTALDEVE